MDLYSIIVIIAFALSVALGFLMGFGRTLKLITGGIVGIIISFVICAMFGGVIANISVIAEWIAEGNAYFGEKSEILVKIHLATILYYIVLFAVIQVLRIVVVKIIAKIFTPEKKESKLYGARNLINKVLGAFLLGAFCLFVVYLIMAILAVLTGLDKVNTFLLEAAEKDTFFYKMFTHNPIDLTVIWG